MKTIIMEQTAALMFASQEEVEAFITENGYEKKSTIDGINYMVKDETIKD